MDTNNTAKEVAKTTGKVALGTAKAAATSTKIIIVWILAVLTIGYLIPGAVATTRGHYNSLAIWCVNIFLGWSLIGWVVALVWALKNSQQVVINNIINEK